MNHLCKVYHCIKKRIKNLFLASTFTNNYAPPPKKKEERIAKRHIFDLIICLKSLSYKDTNLVTTLFVNWESFSYGILLFSFISMQNCKCCRETKTQERKVYLSRCYTTTGGAVIKHGVGQSVYVKEPVNCQCQPCTGWWRHFDGLNRNITVWCVV